MAATARFPTSPIPTPESALARTFALDGDPFADEPDLGVFVPIPAHTAALDALRRWIGEMQQDSRRQDRIAVLTGDEGSGKSRLLAETIQSLDNDRLHLVRLPDVPSHRTDAQLLKAIIAALDAEPVGRTGLELRAEVRNALQALGEKGVQTGLLIDDADFKGSQLELIRNLLRDADGTGFWIILAGTPDLHDRMRRRRSLRGLMGPVLALDDLSAGDLAMLVERRIRAVRTKATPEDLIPAAAMDILSGWAEGNPARMLHAARVALSVAADHSASAVSTAIAEEAIRQLTVAEANAARDEVVAATGRPVQTWMPLPEGGTSLRTTTQRSLWDGEDSV
ncbi:MAG TPA: ATP-binding protein [Thermomicrobiales bacterium]|nr:ATP-binding protein [Thermomicrobiales bacterium]